MKPPLIHPRSLLRPHSERGVTMILVAVAMVAIIAMAALSIDVITLYLAKEEAQRTADAAALAAARVLSMSGITGDPLNVSALRSTVCGPAGIATQAAQAVAAQNAVGSLAASTVNVTYSAPGVAANADCTSLTSAVFGVNPLVTVQIQQAALPTFFSRIWGNSANTVSATATAEAFNPSNSNAGSSPNTTVLPRCVKPWVVPNRDPLNPPQNASGFYCDQPGTAGNPGPGPCQSLVNLTSGAINHPGISTVSNPNNGVIGETFWLESNCIYNRAKCDQLRSATATPSTPIQANLPTNGIDFRENPPNLLYWPNQVGTPAPTAIPACALGDPYEEAIGGCEAPTNYGCGVANANSVDLTRNPDGGSVTNGVSCLIHQADTTNFTALSGQDYLNDPPLPAPPAPALSPAAYPFQILGGSSNPIGGAVSGKPISSSPSIVSLPIYDQTTATVTAGAASNPVTFVGFLQVFINAVDQYGNVNVTVLNVTGCSNNAPGTAVAGTSPVPIRLITPF